MDSRRYFLDECFDYTLGGVVSVMICQYSNYIMVPPNINSNESSGRGEARLNRKIVNLLFSVTAIGSLDEAPRPLFSIHR